MSKQQRLRLVFMCKGTRGDVLPLLSIALSYKLQHGGDEVVFACVPLVLKGLSPQVVDSGLEFVPLPEPQEFEQANISANDLHQDARTACNDALLQREASVCMEAAKGSNLIVFNLFTLEGYFIAQHLNVPCIAASPFVLMKSPPPSFEDKLKDAHPVLYSLLKLAGPGVVSYKEVDHWMWRLFLDDYGRLCERLGIPSLPFACCAATPGPGGPSSLPPPPTPMRYGLSPLVVQRQPYWPESVELTGYWVLPECYYQPPDPSLVKLVEGMSSSVVYIGFGSMEDYVPHTQWQSLIKVVEEALEISNLDGILQAQPNGRIAQGYGSLQLLPLNRLHLWSGLVPHSWLFDKCCVILHHGGSGTVTSALLAGRPQIICPVMFDQHSWAERLTWKGLAVQCSNLSNLTATELSFAFKSVLHNKSDLPKNAKEASLHICKEDGVNKMVKLIEKLLFPSQVIKD